ncbi:MAG: pilus assembly protein [Notoacmeibacter sp.]|nr:pilus assembly protein [Notoacmeibacter sp.]MCC0032486.1 pilus assembly protein [Brucellaceae bacterium]
MFRRFLKDERGNTATIFAVALAPLCLAIGGLTDLTSTGAKSAQLVNALDTAVVAIAGFYQPGMDETQLKALSQKFFDSNMAGVVRLGDDFDVTVTDRGEDWTIEAASTVIHDGMIGNINWRAKRSSQAKIVPGAPACVLALNGTASQSLKIQGSTSVAMDGCVMGANSTSDSAIYRGGSATLRADCLIATGSTTGITGSMNANLECDAPKEGQYPSFDPLAAVEPPSYTACKSVPASRNKSLTPGTFCDKTISGDVTLAPGVYILRGGAIRLGGNGSITGHGVTIFLMEDAQFDLSGNQTVDLSPPTSGPYAGITLYQEASNSHDLTINGTSGSAFSGFVYAPGAHVSYTGNSTTSGTGECVRLVADTIEFNGNSSFTGNCASVLGNRDLRAGRSISLIR